MNNIDYLVTVAVVKEMRYFRLQVNSRLLKLMCWKRETLTEWQQSVVMAGSEFLRKVLWAVTGMHWLIFIKSGPKHTSSETATGLQKQRGLYCWKLDSASSLSLSNVKIFATLFWDKAVIIICISYSVAFRKVPMFGLEAIYRNGVPVGHLRRADYGFYIDKTIGYGYIRNPDGGVVSALKAPTHCSAHTYSDHFLFHFPVFVLKYENGRDLHCCEKNVWSLLNPWK